MFQSFADPDSSNDHATKIAGLRKKLGLLQLDGFYLQRADEHLSEDIPACAERLAWATGFTGSTGQAVILADRAALFVDGRYTLQARNQLDPAFFESFLITETTPAQWIGDNAKKGMSIGFDPRLHSVAQIEGLRKTLAKKEIKLVPVTNNPIDELWTDQPPPPTAPISVHPLKYAGVKPETRISEIQQKMKDDNTDYAILTQPDSIAWLFNIRGQDVPHTPLPLCFAVVPADKRPMLFINHDKLNATTTRHLEKFTDIFPDDRLSMYLQQICSRKARIQLDANSASFWFLDQIDREGVEVIRQADPCTLPKALKNPKEIEGARAAHERDGTAMCRFLAWLDDHAMSGELDEISVAQKLEEFRRDTGMLKDISFNTISGAGPNGAVIHYRVTEKTNRKLAPGTLYLVDSGGQYPDGTTDITRTVAIGEPSREMRTRFTQVLRGMINVSRARFPKGTNGTSLDMLARMALWHAGVDYAHGTGHGVGSYLAVHEGPQSISKKSTVELQPGMILSNEPGYYKEGKFGIRIENLILVTDPTPIKSGETDMMGFETLTIVPIDIRLIDVELLTDEELTWLNRYHAHVRRVISPHLDRNEKAWLKKATATLSRPS